MLAFGLGTMPAMIMTGISASRLSQFMSRKRLGAGLLIVLLGLAHIGDACYEIFRHRGEGNAQRSLNVSLNVSVRVQPLLQPSQRGIGVHQAADVVDERIALIDTFQLFLHAEEERVRRQQNIAVEVRDDSGTGDQIVGNTAVREIESLGRDRTQAIGVYDVIADIQCAGLPGPGRTPRRMTRRINRLDINDPMSRTSPSPTATTCFTAGKLPSSDSATYCGSSR